MLAQKAELLVALCVGARIEISVAGKAEAGADRSPFVWGRGLKCQFRIPLFSVGGRPLCGGED